MNSAISTVLFLGMACVAFGTYDEFIGNAKIFIDQYFNREIKTIKKLQQTLEQHQIIIAFRTLERYVARYKKEVKIFKKMLCIAFLKKNPTEESATECETSMSKFDIHPIFLIGDDQMGFRKFVVDTVNGDTTYTHCLKCKALNNKDKNG